MPLRPLLLVLPNLKRFRLQLQLLELNTFTHSVQSLQVPQALIQSSGNTIDNWSDPIFAISVSFAANKNLSWEKSPLGVVSQDE